MSRINDLDTFYTMMYILEQKVLSCIYRCFIAVFETLKSS